MPSYKSILIGYINKRKNRDGKYLSIQNVSEEDITIKPGDKIFLNMTPGRVREKNPRIPAFSKSVKVEDEFVEEVKKSVNKEEVSIDEIPF